MACEQDNFLTRLWTYNYGEILKIPLIGSVRQQCADDGQCECKPGVTGQQCDACDDTSWDFGPSGCTDCNCLPEGSFNNTPKCDPSNGNCMCKQNVEGMAW